MIWPGGQTRRVGEAFGCPGDRSVGSGYNKQLKELPLMEEIRLTSWYGEYPIIYRVLYIPAGAEFLPSTISPVSYAYLRWSVDSRWWITWFKYLLQLLRGRFHLSVSFDTSVFNPCRIWVSVIWFSVHDFVSNVYTHIILQSTNIYVYNIYTYVPYGGSPI